MAGIRAPGSSTWGAKTRACWSTPISGPAGACQTNGSRCQSLQLSQLAWRRRMTRKAPVPSRTVMMAATAMLGPVVVARADFVEGLAWLLVLLDGWVLLLVVIGVICVLLES